MIAWEFGHWFEEDLVMANNYYGLPVHGQPAQYTAAATAYPAAPAFVGQ